MNTWGISGPRFLLIYVVLLGVATLLAVVARRRALAGPEVGTAVPSRLDPYEAAYLNGGDALVVTTAAASLVRGGQLANAGPRRPGAAPWPTAWPSPTPWPGRGACPTAPGSSGWRPGPTSRPVPSAWPRP